MPHGRPVELVLGSVQLGLPYGAANHTGQPSPAVAVSLVRKAVDSGIAAIDTARAYGDAEDLLGEALRQRPVRTITKLSPLVGLAADASRDQVCAAVDCSISDSMVALKRGRLDCVLLHRADHMTAFTGAVWQRLTELQKDGTIQTLGVSVQSPEEALAALGHNGVRHIQLPFNLLDWRWQESGMIERIRGRRDLTIHIRSVFLQGILASSDPGIWPKVAGVDAAAVAGVIRSLVRELDRESAADLCLAYVRGQDWIDGIVVGMETEEQLQTNLQLFERSPLSARECKEVELRVPRVSAQLLDPARWPKRI